jgi:hypothetical protein
MRVDVSAAGMPLGLILEPRTGKELLGNPRFSHSFLHEKTGCFPDPFPVQSQFSRTSIATLFRSLYCTPLEPILAKISTDFARAERVVA